MKLGVKLVSPTMSGVSLTASTSLKESKAAGAKDINAVMLSYGAGPLQLALAQQTEAAGDVTNISAAYDLGMARISIGSGSLDGANSGNDSTGMTFGVTIPMGAMSVSLGYESGETETNAGAKVSESSGFGVYANYAMSKRTSVYAGYKNATTENAAGAKIGGSKLTGVGLIHRF